MCELTSIGGVDFEDRLRGGPFALDKWLLGAGLFWGRGRVGEGPLEGEGLRGRGVGRLGLHHHLTGRPPSSHRDQVAAWLHPSDWSGDCGTKGQVWSLTQCYSGTIHVVRTGKIRGV